MMAESEKRRQRDQARRDFSGGLCAIAAGSVRIYESHQSGSLMKPITDDSFLFGLTWVFPWASQMLCSITPNCLMTDATFKIMHPYTLEILHAIYGNESIPIAVGGFPSETMESDDRTYRHVQAVLLLNAVPDPNYLYRLRLASDQGSGLKAFVKNRGIDWKLCHRHLIETRGPTLRLAIGWPVCCAVLRFLNFAELFNLFNVKYT
jgi:hypothetical protein